MTRADSPDRGKELMLKVKAGDEEAFAALVGLYQKIVINIVYRYLGDAARAEDLAQEVFLRVYRARKTYKPLARFKTWLYRIAVNLVVNESETRKKQKAVSLEVLRGENGREFNFPDRKAATPMEEMERSELLHHVREAVLALPEKQRLAVVLNKYQDLSYNEVADIMGMSVEAVKSVLFRAREKIRARLDRYLKIEANDEV